MKKEEVRTQKIGFFWRWWDEAEHKSSPEKRLAFYDALFRYIFRGEVPEDPLEMDDSTGVDWAAYDAVHYFDVIDRAIEDMKNGDYGKLGGRPKKKEATKQENVGSDETGNPLVLDNKNPLVSENQNHPSSMNKNMKEKEKENIEVGIRGGMGENPPPSSFEGQLKYPKERLMRMCKGVGFATALKPDQVEPFVDYLIEKGICEKEANQTIGPNYIRAVLATWKKEGYCDKDRHRLTREELKEVIANLNEERVDKINSVEADRFWDYLVGSSFTHSGGDMVTKYTVARMITRWRDIETAEKAAEEAKAREDAAREERIQKLLLSEDED